VFADVFGCRLPHATSPPFSETTVPRPRRAFRVSVAFFNVRPWVRGCDLYAVE